MTKIFIRDLALRCIIGIYPEEREKKQDLIINITMDCSIDDAARTDAIEDTVDYKSIKQGIVAMVEASTFNLIETLADRVADRCLEDERVKRAKVTIDKPGALRFARSVAVQQIKERT